MTRSTTTNRVAYVGDGATTAFTINFPYASKSDIQAVLRSAAGVETTWVENTHYTLTSPGISGTLTAITAPTDYTPAAGETLTIRRVVPLTQETDYPEGGAFPASAHEDALDKLTDIVAQLDEIAARSLKYPVSDSSSISSEIPGSASRAGKYLAFGGDGAPMAAAAPAGTTAVSAFGAALILAAAAAAARALLELGSAALKNTGTSGGDVPLLDGANAWSAIQTFSAAARGTPVVLASAAASIALNLALGNDFDHELTENTTLALPTNLAKGQWFSITLKQHAGAAKTLSFNAAYDFVGSTPSVTTTLGGYAVLVGKVMNATGGSEKIAAFLSNIN